MQNVQSYQRPFSIFKVQDNLPEIPYEIALNIFQYLSPKELLLGASLVSKEWKVLADNHNLWQSFDLKAVFPDINFINEDVWARHVDLDNLGLSFKNLKNLDKRKAIREISKVSSLKTEEKGTTILSIPSGLSLSMTFKSVMASSSKFPPARLLKYYGRNDLKDLKSQKTMQPYQVVITDSNLASDLASRSTFEAQNELLTELGCKMPDLLSSAVHIGITYLTSGKRLYKQEELSYDFKFSACSNLLAGDLPYTFAGSFVESGGQIAFGIAALGKGEVDGLSSKFGSGAMINLTLEAGLEELAL